METRIALFEHQMRLVRSLAPLVILVGGWGCGKTFSVFVKMCHLCSVNPGLRGMILMPTNGMLETTMVPALEELMNRFGVPYKKRGSRGSISFTVFVADHWTEVILRTAEVPRRLDGPNLAWVIIDEAGQISALAYRRATARVRHPRAVLLQVVMVGTPEGMTGPYYREAEEMRLPTTEVIRARTDDNPSLPDDYIDKNLAHLSPSEADAYRNGFFVPPQGRVYHQFHKDQHVMQVNETFHVRAKPYELSGPVHPFLGKGEWFVGCDFNVGRMHWVLGTKIGHTIYIFGELVRENTDTFEQAHECAILLADLMTRVDGQRWGAREAAAEVKVYCDASVISRGSGRAGAGAKSDKDGMRLAGFRRFDHGKANPRIKDRVASVNHALRGGFLLISEDAKETIKCISSQINTELGEPDKRGGLDHGSDAVGYAVHRMRPFKGGGGNRKPWGY